MTEKNTQSATATPSARLQARIAAAKRKRLLRYAADALLAIHVIGLICIGKFSTGFWLGAAIVLLLPALLLHAYAHRVVAPVAEEQG